MGNIFIDFTYYGDYGCPRFLVWPLNSNPRRVTVRPVSGLFESLTGLSDWFEASLRKGQQALTSWRG